MNRALITLLALAGCNCDRCVNDCREMIRQEFRVRAYSEPVDQYSAERYGPYGESYKLSFKLYDDETAKALVDHWCTSGEVKTAKDGEMEHQAVNCFACHGELCEFRLTEGEMSGQDITVYISDNSIPKKFFDRVFSIKTPRVPGGIINGTIIK